MSVYVGIDVHRKRSQVAVVGEDGRVQLNRNVVNGSQPMRALRALLRHRIQLVRLRTLLGNRIHAIAADHGYDRSAGYWSGPGRRWLASLDLPPASRHVIEDDLALIDALASPIAALDAQVR